MVMSCRKKVTPRPKTNRCVYGMALAAILTGSAAAQTADFSKRLAEGQQLRAHDRFAEARAVYQGLLLDVRKEPSPHHLAALVYDCLGLDEQDGGDYGAAETAYNHGLAAVHAQTPDDPILIALQTHLAELYIAEIRPDDAEPILRQAVVALRGSTQVDNIALAIAGEDLAVVGIMRRKFLEPEALLRKSQTLIENAAGPSDPRLTASLLTYAGLLVAQRRFAEAVAPAERAWQLLNTSSMTVPKPFAASALSVLGAVYYHVGRLDEAESYTRLAVDMATASIGPRHPRLGRYLSNYAAILKSAGRKNEAKAIQKKADEILQQSPSAVSGGYTVNVASLR
jgi:tetratricopeptide (TPR) repeat protein